MNWKSATTWVWATAAAVWAAALVTCAATWGRLAGVETRLREKTAIASGLEDLRRELAPGFEALRLHRAWSATAAPVPLAELLKASAPPLAADDIRMTEEDLGAEWRALRGRVAFNAARPAAVAAWIERAETSRPPWRLVRIALRPLSDGDGKAEISLDMQALAPR